jgi:translation initiation factor 4E|tara:strand:- start:983 stop:1522 length:540 start_codon:yes stop_codon:yes gene_type:complete
MEKSMVCTVDASVNNDTSTFHKLKDSWTLWAHLPHDTEWNLNSYKEIMSFNTIEEALTLYETLPDKMIKNCMLFLMRKGITPIWEDEKNRKGGCFSYKIPNRLIVNTWKQSSYALIGETFTDDAGLRRDINGMTISPKKNFCIIKIWIASCNNQNPDKINSVAGINSQGCLFKKHIPEY